MNHQVQEELKPSTGLASFGWALGLAGGLLASALGLDAGAAEPAYAPLLAYNSISRASTLETVDFTRVHRAESKPALAATEPPHFSASLTLRIEKISVADISEPRSGERYFADLTRVRGSGLLDEGSVVLFRTRVPSRFSYQSWAGLHSGYGQLFASPDTVGRSRSNGAGIDDPSCLYLKLSLNF